MFFAFVQLLLWGVVFQRLAWYKSKKTHSEFSLPAVSVIICARNEAANLQKNLESVLSQDYPSFEVIVVEDDSSDDSLSVLQDFKKQYSHLQIVKINDKKSKGKKAALSAAINIAENEWILLTDADCKPISEQWILNMVKCTADPAISVVLGYAPYYNNRRLISKWVQFETMFVAIQYISSALWKLPYMGVGRNLMYKKSVFGKNMGFENHKHLPSGDDDLFVNEVSNGDNTTVCLDNHSFMYSECPSSWKDLYFQKVRHYSVSTHYKPIHKLFLGLVSLSHFSFYLGLFAIIVLNIWNCAILVIIILRTFLLHMVMIRYMNNTNNFHILPFVCLFDVIVPFYYLIFGINMMKEMPPEWK